MAIEPGTRLGPYEIVAPIGAGGMGEVYRARDTRLDRTVAIKILPSELSQNSQLRLRFEREAKAISSLAHPHICTVHDVGRENGVDYLVMELIEGETLADRLTRGPMEPGEVVRHGIDIADALEKAHRSGIVHRDLKPSNVMLTKNGAKLLDFGLAKTTSGPEPREVAATSLATEQRPLTERGTILGTFQYMSPEQLEGREVDARTDIFALGALLYEMATGRRAFDGKSKASLIAAILATEPPPVSQVQPLTPASLDRVIRLCLSKDPEERWQSAHDVKLELLGVAETVTAPRSRSSRLTMASGWIAAAVILAAATLGGIAHFRKAHATSDVRRVEIAPPASRTFNFVDGPVAVSPDGRRFLVLLSGGSPGSRLAIRDVDSFEYREVGGLQGIYDQFWSPDGRQVGFFKDARMRRADVSGGSPKSLASVGDSRGASWAPDGTILFAPTANGPIMRMPASGGALTVVTHLDASRKQTGHWRPSLLPDGRHFLYTARSSDADLTGVYAASLDSSQVKRVLDVDTTAIYSDGYLLYVDNDDLYAQPFDAGRIEKRGDPTLLAKSVELTRVYGSPGYSAAGGVLAYHTRQTTIVSPLFRVDRRTRERVNLPDLTGTNVDLSRDDSRIAVQRLDPQTHTEDIWTYDLKRGTSTRISFDPAPDIGPVWSADSKWIAYVSPRNDMTSVLRKLASGGGAEEVMAQFPGPELEKLGITNIEVSDWSRDGRYLLVEIFTTNQHTNIAVLDLTVKNPTPRPIIATPFGENSGRFSPDGRWIAYWSNESGTGQVYVQPFPPTGAKWQISTDGGNSARWRGDGREIYYVARDHTVMAAEVSVSGSDFTAGTPKAILDNGANDLVVTSDGMTFLASETQPPSANPISVVMNWSSALKK